VVSHARARLLADLADATGLSAAMSEALAALRKRDRGHAPGRVAVDLAVMLADGGEAIADMAVLRNRSELFGEPGTALRWSAANASAGFRHVSSRVHPRPRAPG
jgi:hypothetical protein